MKRYFNIAIKYAAAAMIWGVFYREFTKWNDFTGVTALGRVHGHMLTLGMFVFLLVALFTDRFPVEKERTFSVFLVVYNIGVPLTSLMLAVRGIFQVLGTQLSRGASAAISGIAGIGHILTGVGLILLLLALKKAALRSREA